MTSNLAGSWLHLREMFARADLIGVDSLELATTLLNRATDPDNPIVIMGLRRQFELVSPSDDNPDCPDRNQTEVMKERFPRDKFLSPIPLWAWGDIKHVDSNLNSRWVDDEDKPNEFTIVDWIGGSLETSQYYWKPLPGPEQLGTLEYMQTNYDAMQIDMQLAKDLLRQLNRHPKVSSKADDASTPATNHRPRELDHDYIRTRAGEIRSQCNGISKASVAASIVSELGPNPKTERPYDQRGIERIIARLWGGQTVSPPLGPYSPS